MHYLPFLDTSNSTRFSKFCISGGKRWISLSLKPNFLKRLRRKKFWKRTFMMTFYESFLEFKSDDYHNMPSLYFITFGRSRIWFASSRSSSKLLAYRIMSSGTVLKVQCRLSTYSTWRLHPFKKPGTHLNILGSVVVDVLLKRLHEDLYLMTTQYFSYVAQIIPY